MREELIKLNSDKEYQDIKQFLKDLGEHVFGVLDYTNTWNVMKFNQTEWELANKERLNQPFNLISYSEFISKYSKKEETTTTGLDKYKVYIKGDKTRGLEVIKKLESLGGKNVYSLEGWATKSYYYIDNFGDIRDSQDLDLTDRIELFLDVPATAAITKVEIFPGIYVGDVVVSLKERHVSRKIGDIFKVLVESKKGHLYYKKGFSNSDTHEWRLATLEEKEAFENGITNINDIKKEPEEDFSKFIGQWVTYHNWSDKSVCKVTKISENLHYDNKYYIDFDEGYVNLKKNYHSAWSANTKELKILSKEELKDYLPEKVYMKEFPENIVPEYLELLPNYCTELNGTIFKTSEPYKKPTRLWDNALSWQDFWDKLSVEYRKKFFKASTKKEYEKQYIRPKFITDVDPTVKSTSLQDYLKSLPNTFSDNLEGFPKEVVQKMVERQVEQGNEPDYTIFEKSRTVTKFNKGFVWELSKDGFDFWNNVILYKKFDVFYEKYPKTETKVTLTKIYDVEGNTYGILTSDGKPVEFDVSCFKKPVLSSKICIDDRPNIDDSVSETSFESIMGLPYLSGYDSFETKNPCYEIPLETKPNTFDHLPFVQVKELPIF
jgi:hypothetical protein